MKQSVWVLMCMGLLQAQSAPPAESVPPRTWDSRALADWATPLASINIRPGHFSEEEYYRAPLDNYRTYPVYHPDREPPGYWETLKKKKPEPLVEISAIGPTFNWAIAGKRVWDEIDVPFEAVAGVANTSPEAAVQYPA